MSAGESGDEYMQRGKKACRTCVDFKTWMKHQQQKIQYQDSKSDDQRQSGEPQRRPDCPVDKDELGRSTWAFLHTTAANFPEKPSNDQKKEMTDFIGLFARLYPCEPCALDFQRDIRSNPPVLDTRSQFAKWLCERHNTVNRKLGKKEFDCGLVDQRWRDGWTDGSCG